jgi:hypothetical protein
MRLRLRVAGRAVGGRAGRCGKLGRAAASLDRRHGARPAHDGKACARGWQASAAGGGRGEVRSSRAARRGGDGGGSVWAGDDAVTKVKNVELIELGEYRIRPWYFSPFPEELCRKGVIFIDAHADARPRQRARGHAAAQAPTRRWTTPVCRLSMPRRAGRSAATAATSMRCGRSRTSRSATATAMPTCAMACRRARRSVHGGGRARPDHEPRHRRADPVRAGQGEGCVRVSDSLSFRANCAGPILPLTGTSRRAGPGAMLRAD